MKSYMTSLSWLAIALGAAVAIMQPVGLQAQFLFGLTGVAVMAAIKFFKLTGFWRHMFLVVGSAVVLRYLYWRVTSTLPPVYETANFIPGLLLFLAEVYSVSMLAINMTVVADPIRRKPEPLRGQPRDWPTVDIFVPSYNEDLEILGVTLAACRNLEYPTDKLNVYLLDDGGTDFRCNHHKDPKVREGAKQRRAEFTRFCQDLGVHYLTRARNEHAKAGNMNEALKVTKGDIVVVFDADHAPSRDFLKKTIGYFQADPRLFLAQTPHQFLNPDPVEKNLETFERMPSENEMFYSIIQRGLDKWNGSFFCGSAAVLRRTALNEVGGFAGITITEDCETAVELHSRGWNSAFIDEPMIAGFQPETFTSFIGQRSRWCQGMLQILILKRPAFKRGLSMPQRLAYLSIMLNWLFPLSRLMFMIAPVFYILFDLHIYNASFDEFMAFTVFSFIASAMMQNYIFSSVRWPWMSELYEYVQCWHLSRAIISVILKPRSPSFNVTNKAETLEKDFFSGDGWFHLGMFTLLAVTCAVGAWRLWQEGGTNELLYVIGFWAIFNLGIAGMGLGAVAERKQRRRHYRMPYAGGQVLARIEVDGKSLPVDIHDIAIGGLMVKGETGVLPTEELVGKVVKLHLVKGRRAIDPVLHTFNVEVRWSNIVDGEARYGLEFWKPNGLDRRAQALLMFPNAEALARYKKNRVGDQMLSAGTTFFVKHAVMQTFRGLRMAGLEVKSVIDAKFAKPDVAQAQPAPQAQPMPQAEAQPQPNEQVLPQPHAQGTALAPAQPQGGFAENFAAASLAAPAPAPAEPAPQQRALPHYVQPTVNPMPAAQPQPMEMVRPRAAETAPQRVMQSPSIAPMAADLSGQPRGRAAMASPKPLPIDPKSVLGPDTDDDDLEVQTGLTPSTSRAAPARELPISK